MSGSGPLEVHQLCEHLMCHKSYYLLYLQNIGITRQASMFRSPPLLLMLLPTSSDCGLFLDFFLFLIPLSADIRMGSQIILNVNLITL